MDRDFIILLAEDDENDIIFVTRALRKAMIFCPLYTVRDGDQAIRYLRGDGEYADRTRFPLPNLALLDIKMPRLTGLEVLHWLRTNSPDRLRRLPVIIMSGSHLQQDIDRAYDLGVNAYLVKPRAFEELVDVLKKTGDFWRDAAERPGV